MNQSQTSILSPKQRQSLYSRNFYQNHKWKFSEIDHQSSRSRLPESLPSQVMLLNNGNGTTRHYCTTAVRLQLQNPPVHHRIRLSTIAENPDINPEINPAEPFLTLMLLFSNTSKLFTVECQIIYNFNLQWLGFQEKKVCLQRSSQFVRKKNYKHQIQHNLCNFCHQIHDKSPTELSMKKFQKRKCFHIC